MVTNTRRRTSNYIARSLVSINDTLMFFLARSIHSFIYCHHKRRSVSDIQIRILIANSDKHSRTYRSSIGHKIQQDIVHSLLRRFRICTFATFHRILIDLNDAAKTVFISPFGLYEFNVLTTCLLQIRHRSAKNLWLDKEHIFFHIRLYALIFLTTNSDQIVAPFSTHLINTCVIFLKISQKCVFGSRFHRLDGTSRSYFLYLNHDSFPFLVIL
jgi:hypothetical protein